MRLDHLLADVVSRLLGRLVRRIVAGILVGLFALGMIYHLTAAGTLELASLYGPVYARLIIAGLYAVAAVIPLGFLIATRAKPLVPDKERDNLSEPRSIAMLIESALLGYSLARGPPRSGFKRT
jgi:hypothetical protein